MTGPFIIRHRFGFAVGRNAARPRENRQSRLPSRIGGSFFQKKPHPLTAPTLAPASSSFVGEAPPRAPVSSRGRCVRQRVRVHARPARCSCIGHFRERTSRLRHGAIGTGTGARFTRRFRPALAAAHCCSINFPNCLDRSGVEVPKRERNPSNRFRCCFRSRGPPRGRICKNIRERALGRVQSRGLQFSPLTRFREKDKTNTRRDQRMPQIQQASISVSI
jgi:hypothetical protein